MRTGVLERSCAVARGIDINKRMGTYVRCEVAVKYSRSKFVTVLILKR